MKEESFRNGITKRTFDTREGWLENRRLLGGSDASCIVNANPWKTSFDLWQEKVGKKEPKELDDNPLVVYGRNAESHLRELFALDYPNLKVYYEENNSFFNPKYPFAQASLDGWLEDEDGRLGILEIKTTTISSAVQSAKWKGQIPQNYYIQVLWYLGVMEADFVYVKAQLKYEIDGTEPYTITRHYKIERADVEDDISYLMEEGRKFWDLIQGGEEPSVSLPDI